MLRRLLLLLILATNALAVLPAKDDFNRASLGSNWSQTGLISAVGCTINASTVLAANGGTFSAGVCFWNADTITTASYACGQIVNGAGPGTTPFGRFDAGVCLGVDNVGGSGQTGHAMCCTASPPRSGSFGSEQWFADAWVNGMNSLEDFAPLVWSANDYVGITRTDATHFQCFRSTDGHTWTATSPVESIIGVTAPGSLGAYAWSAVDNPFELTNWEGGNGTTLPADHICGTNTPVSTTTTITTTTTTTTTTATTTTTTATMTTVTTTTQPISITLPCGGNVDCATVNACVSGTNCDTSVGLNRVCTTHLSSSQILNIHTTPVTVIPAAGAGKTVFPTRGIAGYTAGGTPYSATSLVLSSPGPEFGTIYNISGSGFIGSSVSVSLFLGLVVEIDGFATLVADTNQPWQLTAASNPTTGNGTIDITLVYDVRSFP